MNAKVIWYCHKCQKHGAVFYHGRMSVDVFLYQFKASHERESPDCDSKSVVAVLFDTATYAPETDETDANLAAIRQAEDGIEHLRCRVHKLERRLTAVDGLPTSADGDDNQNE